MAKKYTKKSLLQREIATLMLEKKAVDVNVLDVRDITTLTDYFVICTSESDPQTRAIVTHIDKSLKEWIGKPSNVEGLLGSDWVLMDYLSVVAHVFTSKSREFYNLESLWGDAKIESITDDEGN